jgi:putative ABC transport system permease protein
MLRVAVKMLLGDQVKYTGLLFGIAFTSFLVTFAGSYLAGFMTNGFALVSENPRTDVWVMDPAVRSVEPTTNMPSSALDRVRSVEGVATAVPLALGMTNVRFPNGRFQSFQVIGVDDATLAGVPPLRGGLTPIALRTPDAVIVDPGGTTDKLQTPVNKADQWYDGPPRLDVPTRTLAAGDDLLVNDRRVTVVGRAKALPRYPARPLMYTTYSNALRILPPERRRLTFVLVTAAPGIAPPTLARRIEDRTGLRARSSADFKADTVWWVLANSEDVGDIETMVSIAVLVGFGVTGVLLYMFTNENLRQYAVLKAMGATPRLLLTMIFVQAGLCAIIGTGLGLGACAIAAQFLTGSDYPFRMMWFTPVVGTLMVLVVSVVSASISARPALKLEPGMVFAGR